MPKESGGWGRESCPSVQTSHLTMHYRGFKSKENRRRGSNKVLLVGNRRGLRASQRKCLHSRDSEG